MSMFAHRRAIAGGTKGASRDIGREKTVGRTQQTDRETECGGEVGGGHPAKEQGGGVTVRGNRLVIGGGGRAKVEKPASGGRNWAKERVAAAPQADHFTAHTILLRGELERDERGSEKLGGGRSGDGKTDRAEKQMSVAGPERLRRGGGAGILPRAQQKKESKADHISKGARDRVSGSMGLGHDVHLRVWGP